MIVARPTTKRPGKSVAYIYGIRTDRAGGFGVWIAAAPALDARGTPSEITAVNDALSNSEPEEDLDLQQLRLKPLPHRGDL